jgi:hypothetical protein
MAALAEPGPVECRSFMPCRQRHHALFQAESDIVIAVRSSRDWAWRRQPVNTNVAYITFMIQD